MKSFLVFIIILFLATGCQRPGDGREGGTDKREWSILQGLEATNKEPKTKISIQKEDEYLVICIPRSGDHKPIWIMADARSAPFYKQMPQASFTLTEAELEEIRKAEPDSSLQKPSDHLC